MDYEERDTATVEDAFNSLVRARDKATLGTINARHTGSDAASKEARAAHAAYADRYRELVTELVGVIGDVRMKNHARAEIIHDLNNEVGGLRLCVDGALAELAELGDDPTPEAMAAVLARVDDILCASRPDKP